MHDGYIRVSRVAGRSGESFISPDVQWTAIEKYAAAKGVEVARSEDELDVSGSKLVRPVLDGIMGRIRSGESQGIIVATVDRLSRAGLGDAIKLVEEIRDAGGTVGFAELDIDTVSEAGEFALNIWLSLAHMQWRGYQRKWNTARQRAVERGVFVGASPLGYDRNEDRTLTPNADAPKIARAFEISEDEGLNACLAYVRETFPDGPRSKRNWTITNVEVLLANRIYIGEMKDGEYVAQFPELAIVDRYRFDLAQHVRPIIRRSATGNVYPLTGIASCGSCGRTLVGQTSGPNRRRYRCISRTCTGRVHVHAEPLEALILAAVRANPPTVSTNEMLQRSARVLVASEKLEQHLTSQPPTNAETWLRHAWKSQEAVLRDDLALARAVADATHGDLPDLDAELSGMDLRTVFERSVEVAAVKKGRGDLAERVELALRA
jgi:DNA invertase Pin-like site-specific DNA recombinase